MTYSSPVRFPLSSAVLTATIVLAACSGGGGGGAVAVAPAPNANSAVTANPLSLPADGASLATLTATVVDRSGLPLAGQVVEFAASGSGNTLTQPAAVTNQNGVATGTLSSTTAELKAVTATVNPQSGAVALAQTASVEFTATFGVQGVARYRDENRNGLPDLGDTVIVPFATDVSVTAASVADFALAVDQDSFGQGASVQAGPAANEATITLGAGARLRTRGRFTSNATGSNSPSGIDVAAAVTSIVGTANMAVLPSTPIDIVPVQVAATSLAVSGAIDAAIGNVNNDGKADVVVATASSVQVFTGDGGFGMTFDAQVNTSALRGVVLADLNRFTNDEMVTAQSDGAQVWQNTSGTFTPGVLLPSGDTRDVAVADFSGNGSGDIVAAGGGGVRVFPHLGALGNSFGAAVVLSTNAATSVVVGDFDGDGDVDALVAFEGTGGVRLFKNDGAGSFTAGNVIATNGVVDLAAGDFDSDGDLDATAARGAASTVLLQNAGGTFSASDVAIPAARVAMADLDGDSRSDLILGDGAAVSEWLSDGQSFRDSGARSTHNGVAALRTALIDADGDVDVVVADATGARLQSGSLTGTFGDTNLVSDATLGAASSNAVAMGDVDGDGDLDQVVANDGDNQVWLNDGAGNFTFSGTQGHILGQGLSQAVVLGDLDQDGDLDAVIGNTNTFGADNEVWQNDGAGNFQQALVFAAGSKTLSLALTRFDADAQLDIVVGNDGENQVFRNTTANGVIAFAEETGRFSLANSANLDRETVAILVFDLDTDGDEDLITINRGTTISPQETQVWRKANLLYTLRHELNNQQMATCGTLGDWDADGILDLAVGHQSPNGNQTVRIYRGLRTALNTLPTSVSTGSETVPAGLALTDLNGDGIADLVIVNRNAPSEVLLGDGQLGFTAAQTLASDDATDMVARDIDADGDIDVVTTVGNATANRVYRNR